MVVRSLVGDDWALWRNLRLEALLADPEAFGSTYAREVQFDEATWRQRLTNYQDRPIRFFADEVNGQAAGMAGIGFFASETVPMLVSMWVRPSARRLGCGRRLVDATIAWAGEQNATEVMLWVIRENLDAIHLYRSCGFAAVASDPPTELLEMRFLLP